LRRGPQLFLDETLALAPAGRGSPCSSPALVLVRLGQLGACGRVRSGRPERVRMRTRPTVELADCTRQEAVHRFQLIAATIQRPSRVRQSISVGLAALVPGTRSSCSSPAAIKPSMRSHTTTSRPRLDRSSRWSAPTTTDAAEESRRANHLACTPVTGRSPALPMKALSLTKRTSVSSCLASMNRLAVATARFIPVPRTIDHRRRTGSVLISRLPLAPFASPRQPNIALDQLFGVLSGSEHRWRGSVSEDGSCSIQSLRESGPAHSICCCLSMVRGARRRRHRCPAPVRALRG
jgi:hypothetical protein